MSITHKSAAYKPLDIPNPMKGMDKAYADILAHNINELNWWRRVAGIGSLALFFISFLFWMRAASLQKTVPVLVNVMPSGEAAYLGEVKPNAGTRVPEAAIIFQAKKFVHNLRSVPTDRQVLYDNIIECYAMVTSSYDPIMTKALRNDSPFDLVGKERRSVEFESALRVTGSSYQLDWRETSITSGASQRVKKMRALVTIKLLEPTDKTIKVNPLGIYIENYEVTAL